MVWGSLCLMNREAIYKKRKLFQTSLYKYNLFKNLTYFLQFNFYNKFNDSSILICCWQMNMLVTSQYQRRLLSIANVAPGGSANQISVFTSN
jgi:galactose-1-phosphate uridylyltransferase